MAAPTCWSCRGLGSCPLLVSQLEQERGGSLDVGLEHGDGSLRLAGEGSVQQRLVLGGDVAPGSVAVGAGAMQLCCIGQALADLEQDVVVGRFDERVVEGAVRGGPVAGAGGGSSGRCTGWFAMR